MLLVGFAVVLLVLCEHFCFSELTLNSTEDPGAWTTDSPLQTNLLDAPGTAQTVPTTAATNQEFKKVCRGSSTGLAHVGMAHERYEMYRKSYTNCTYIDGNLELVFLGEPSGKDPYDLSFLQNIREITGYVLIVANYADYIPLTSLRIIRGRTLFEHESKYYSLYVALNYKPQSTVGLKELWLTSLHEILAGSVFFFNNNLLCYEDTVNWRDIVTGEGAEVVISHNEKHYRRQCGQCNESCEFNGNRHCWGNGSENCQQLTRVSCSPQCDGRCFGFLPNQCCHSECAGGCSGPTKSDCWSCKNFENEGMCENFCPPEFVYSPREYRQVLNPNAKYAYGSFCVDKCPAHLIADKGACVKDCGVGRAAGKEGKCVECEGPCPKSCRIQIDDNSFIHSGNINQYKGCTIIHGSIKILEVSFTGDEYNKIGPMKMSQLSVLETIQEVSDFVQIQANDKEFRSLSILQNLRVIHGRRLDSSRASLQIFKTSLEVLGFESLREVKHGTIYIANNSRLCYASSVNWDRIRESEKQKVIIEHNRNSTSCAHDNEVCHAECTDDGCWGPLEDQCISCQHFRFGRRCLSSCESLPGVYTSSKSKECQRCHPECFDNCTGPGNNNCSQCRNARDGPYCIPKCPISKYKDENGICQPCHTNCEEGCTGPRNIVGPGGCNSCGLVVFARNRKTVTKCLPAEEGCEDGFYQQILSRTQSPGVLSGKQGCMMCHPECKTCSGFGLSFCTSCRHFFQGDKCVPECTSDYYFLPGDGRCHHCNSQCLRCNGATASDCVVCKLYKIYINFENRDIDPRFNCTDKCPDSAPHKMTVDMKGEIEVVCVAEDALTKNRSHVIVGIVCGALAFVTLVLFGVAMLCRQRAQAEATKMKLTAQMSGIDEAEPLKPTDVKPNMSMLRLVKESELRCGYMIGSGAFGMVYKGLWIPEGENLKIPVAIKVLQKGSSGKTEELLEEARIMASVVHPSCIRILCVCLTAQVMLITQLMPLGCLLDYVRKNRSKISSSALLNWCTQIARGMDYLESRGIVHCDLAARNVLVQSPQVVKITDFGLARMLDCDHDKYLSEARKMPIKWLALESIVHRVFTHKSDVWSFGVTVWELMTFGLRPYENIHVRDIPILLEKGERLHQPTICTLDVYMLMIKCWMLDVYGRPSFRELSEEFSKMARDPGRYLSIPGDRFLRYSRSQSDGGTCDRNLDLKDHEMADVGALFGDDSGENGCPLRYANSERCGRFSGLEKSAAFRHPQSKNVLSNDHHNSFRYCSDPCRASVDAPGGLEPIQRSGSFQSSASESSRPAETSAKMVVYEDDYLKPKSLQVTSNYLELTDGSSEPVFSDVNQNPPIKNRLQLGCMLNPEYFLSFYPKDGEASRLHPGAARSSVNPYDVDSPKARHPNASDCKELRCGRNLYLTGSDSDYYNEILLLNGSLVPTTNDAIVESPI